MAAQLDAHRVRAGGKYQAQRGIGSPGADRRLLSCVRKCISAFGGRDQETNERVVLLCIVYSTDSPLLLIAHSKKEKGRVGSVLQTNWLCRPRNTTRFVPTHASRPVRIGGFVSQIRCLSGAKA